MQALSDDKQLECSAGQTCLDPLASENATPGAPDPTTQWGALICELSADTKAVKVSKSNAAGRLDVSESLGGSCIETGRQGEL